VLDLISDCISESFDEEWTARDGARHVLGGLQHEGIALVRTTQCSGDTQELADEFADLDAGLDLKGEPCVLVPIKLALRILPALRTTHSPSEAGVAVHASAKIEMDREGYPLPRS